MSEFDLPDVYRMIAGRRGAITAREWIGQSDGRAESPLETRSRLRCADGGVPPGELQAVIRSDEGLVIARADMLWTGTRMITVPGRRHAVEHAPKFMINGGRGRMGGCMSRSCRIWRPQTPPWPA